MTMIEELREWAKEAIPEDLTEKGYEWAKEDVREILSRHEEAEPLAVLAVRKGYRGITYEWYTDITGHRAYYCTPYKSYPDCGEPVDEAPTYAEAEAKAREWLGKQEDKI